MLSKQSERRGQAEAKLLLEAYGRIFDRCLVATDEDKEKWPNLPTWRRPLKLSMGSDMDEYILAESLPEMSKVSAAYRDTIVMGAVYATFLSGRKDFPAFEAELGRSIQDWLRRPKIPFEVWLHLDVSPIPDWLSQLKVAGTAMTIVSVNDLTSRLAMGEIEDLRNLEKIEFASTPWLMKASLDAWDQSNAFEQVGGKVEILRGVLNLVHHGLHQIRKYGGTKELCRHYPPVLYAASENGAKPKVYSGYGTNNIGKKPIDNHDMMEVKRWLRYFEGAPAKDSIKSRLAEAVVLASNGLDSIYPDQQFLAMWTALERLALVDSGSPNEVAKRIPRLWSNGPSSDLAFALKRLALRRNRLVHEGYFDHEDDGSLLWLRHSLISTIARLIAMRGRLKSLESLTELYRSAGLTKSQLRARIIGIEEAVALKESRQ